MMSLPCVHCRGNTSGHEKRCPLWGVDTTMVYSVDTEGNSVGEKAVAKSINPKDAIGDRKVPLALCSPIAEAHWAVAQFAGREKYGAWNWRDAGVSAEVYISAMKRHVAGYLSGERVDPADNTHHLGNVMACCAILLEAEAAGVLLDNRPPIVSHRPAYAEVEETMAQLRVKYADRNPRHWTIADSKTR